MHLVERRQLAGELRHDQLAAADGEQHPQRSSCGAIAAANAALSMPRA